MTTRRGQGFGLLVIVALGLAGCYFPLTEPDPIATAPQCRQGDPVCDGRQLAETRCARCHAISSTGNSPYPGAQPFRAFNERWRREALAQALETGIIAEHDNSGVKLPEMKLNRTQIKALFVYLDWLDQQPAQTVEPPL